MAQQKTHWFWDLAVLWPFICLALMIPAFIVLAVLSSAMSEDAMVIFGIIFGSLAFLFYIASIVIMIVTYVYAIHRLYTRTNLPEDQKKTWLILIVIFSYFAIPILHFMHLRVK
jgi:hypothetical protein